MTPARLPVPLFARALLMLWVVGCSKPNSWEGSEPPFVADSGAPLQPDAAVSDPMTDAGPADAGPDSPDSPVATVTDRPNVVFVTSATYVPGNLGGVAAGDEACNALAQAAGLPGTYVAHLSARLSSVSSRLGTARGWVRTDGKPFMDVFSEDARMTPVYFPPELDERGAIVGDASPAAGSGQSGDCAGFTSTVPMCGPRYGVPSGGNGGWNGFAGCVRCSERVRLYCLGRDANYPLKIEKTTGRIAFVTSGTWLPSGGISAADAFCRAEAQMAGFTGVFKALLATTQASAASRFDAATGTRPWVRPDGIALVQRAADLFVADGKTLSAFQVTPDLQYLGGGHAWTGADNVQSPGTPTTTCSDWTSSSGTGDGGAPAYTQILSLFGDYAGTNCSGAGHLYCLED